MRKCGNSHQTKHFYCLFSTVAGLIIIPHSRHHQCKGSRRMSTGVLNFSPYICFIVTDCIPINIFHFLVQSFQHLFLVLSFKFTIRKHPRYEDIEEFLHTVTEDRRPLLSFKRTRKISYFDFISKSADFSCSRCMASFNNAICCLRTSVSLSLRKKCTLVFVDIKMKLNAI